MEGMPPCRVGRAPWSTRLLPGKDVMNSLPRLLAVALATCAASAAFANPDLAQKKNCMACHTVDKKVLGPSYKEVASKYAGQADAADKLTQKIIKGSSGTWGPVPMPPNPQVSEAEAKQLVQWVLNQK
jgi:cytochrome c